MSPRAAVAEVQPIAVTRRQAAAMVGLSIDVIKDAQHRGELKAKVTRKDEVTGRSTGTTLYDVAELRRWFEGLPDA